MQLVCEQCGTVGPAAKVEVVAGAVHLTCGGCGAVASLGTIAPTATNPGPAAQIGSPLAAGGTTGVPGAGEVPPVALLELSLAPLAESSEADAPAFAAGGVALAPVKCPKCGHRQHDEDACHRCGLVFARVADGRRPWEADYTESQRQRLPEAARQFDRVEQRPDDAARHEAFVQWCRDADMMFFAAQRYAHLAADRPSDPVTTRYRQQVTSDLHAATMALVRSDTAAPDGSQKVRAALLAIVVVACVAALMLLARMMRGAPTGLP